MCSDDEKITWGKKRVKYFFFQVLRPCFHFLFLVQRRLKFGMLCAPFILVLTERQRNMSWCHCPWRHTWCCLTIFKIYLFSVYVHVCEPMWVHTSQEHAIVPGGLKNVQVPKWELQAAVNCLVWALETQLRSCAGAAGALSHGVSLQSPSCLSGWKNSCNNLCGPEEFHSL